MPAPRDDGARGAQRNRPTFGRRFSAYLHHHRVTLRLGFERLLRQPLGSLMTVMVIGIALALPSGLLVLVQNARTVSGNWQGAARLSLYLKPAVSDTAAAALAQTLRGQPGVAAVRLITPEQALAEFQQRSGFSDALQLLSGNPLPAVLVIQPTAEAGTPGAAQNLARTFAALPQVDQVRMDITWLRRLQAMLEVFHRIGLLVALLLALAVVLVVGNTIRLDIGNRRAEIEVSKLLGATDGFIRRPLLYFGASYGLAGGVLAWLLVSASLLLLAGPVRHLAGLYGSPFSLRGLGLDGSLMLFLGGILLGWLGAWLAVARHLRDIEPS